MKKANDFKNFFPVDNSMSTNNYYDLVSEKFMNGVDSYNKRKNNTNTIGDVFIFSSAIFQLFAGLIIVVLSILKEIIRLLR